MKSKTIFSILGIILCLFAFTPFSSVQFDPKEPDNRIEQPDQVDHFSIPTNESTDQSICLETKAQSKLFNLSRFEAEAVRSIPTRTDASFFESNSIENSKPISNHAGIGWLAGLMALANFVGRLLRRSRDFNEAVIMPSVVFMSALRKALESKKLEALLAAIPGDWDKKFVDSMKSSLATVIRAYGVIEEGKKKLSIDELIEQYLAWLDAQPQVVQSALLAKTASLISLNRSKLQYKENETDLFVQAFYTSAKAHA